MLVIYNARCSVGLFLVLVGCEEQDNFFFDPSPVDQDIVEGRETRLRCDVSSRKMIVFYWTLNGKQIQSNSRRFQDDGDLRFVRVDRLLDAGSFRCVATNISTGMALRSTEARLNIFCKSLTLHRLRRRCQEISAQWESSTESQISKNELFFN